MATHITWNGTTLEISGLPENQPHEHRRNATRVSPSWRVTIKLEGGLNISADIADLSFRAFRTEIPEMLEIGTEVQFSISENGHEYLDGQAVKGEAIVLLRVRRGTVFEFQEFKENDFNQLCVALRRYIDDSADQNE